MIDKKREFGDWQTPIDFAIKCCSIVSDHIGFDPGQIIEPTCGLGNFISAANFIFPNVDILGIEINKKYLETLNNKFRTNPHVEIREGDYLKESTLKNCEIKQNALFIGNPPWATNSYLSSNGATNIPSKSNIKSLKGIDALTGFSNFDICECMILRSVQLLKSTNGMIALLCKTNVARNVCAELSKMNSQACCWIINFDSKKIFDVSAPACLFICDFRSTHFQIIETEIENLHKKSYLECKNGKIHRQLDEESKAICGKSVLEWRQGVKHDCTKVMVLTRRNHKYFNGLGDVVEIEENCLFPFLKSSMLKYFEIDNSNMYVAMTQAKIGEDTSHLKNDAPKFWNYLLSHAKQLDGRKSSIYKTAPRFAMFGVGDYSYAPYKVAVSGFYKTPKFVILKSNKPIMLDDTCYFLPFWKKEDALVCMLLLNSPLVQNLYTGLAFLDNKRPFTKSILSQLDILSALKRLSVASLNETASNIGISSRINEQCLINFTNQIQALNQSTASQLF